MPPPETEPVLAPVEVTVRGDVAEQEREYARSKVALVRDEARAPVLAAHVVLTTLGDPARERPALAEASLDVNGTQIRGKAAASDLRGATDLLEARLRRGLRQHRDRERTRHRWIGVASEHEWRHGDLPTARGATFPRPPAEREVVRRKSFALEPLDLDEAAFDMEMLGHDFYLFTDAVTGQDVVVERTGDGRYAVHGHVDLDDHLDGLVDLQGEPPVLTEAEARTRLDLAGEPFVFYRDPDDGRGRVLYVRYDGHYGLITAA